MPANKQFIFLCVLRGYNHQYFDDDCPNTDPLWKHLTERFVAARDHDRAKWLFIRALVVERFPMPEMEDCRVQINEWTGQWQDHYETDEFLRLFITDRPCLCLG